MKKIIHRASERGSFDYGWLKTSYSFNFARWYNPDRMNFGLLRVLNDDVIAPGGGFPTHDHSDMEIATIPLSGQLAHKDNASHEEVIKPNDVQVMSAGTKIEHSEFNKSDEEPVSLLQIWVFPDAQGHEPRYDQKTFDPAERKNKLQTVISPKKENGTLWLHQDTYFSLADLDKERSLSYKINSAGNGVYVFVIDGKIIAVDETLDKRDAIGLWETEEIEIKSVEDSSILLIEVPMA